RGHVQGGGAMPVRRTALFARRPDLVPRAWDLALFGLIFGALALVGLAGRETLQPLAVSAAPITLDPAALPHYALRTTLRMLLAMGASLIFTFAFGALAAKSRRAEVVLVPMLDVLQS